MHPKGAKPPVPQVLHTACRYMHADQAFELTQLGFGPKTKTLLYDVVGSVCQQCATMSDGVESFV